jgi:uncharacterized LabA/DUF88 family protein
MESTLIFVDDGFFGLVKKHLQKKAGKESHPEIKKIILIASDSDFAPVIERMKAKDVGVILYTYFDRKRDSRFSTSNHLLRVASKWVRLNESYFEDSK